MFSPARWTTASTLANSAASIVPSSGSQRISFCAGACTAHDRADKVAIGFERVDSAVPTKPLEPVMAMIMVKLSAVGCRSIATTGRWLLFES